MKARAAWNPDRPSKVPEYSEWKRRHPTRDTAAEVWKVTARYRFEAGSNGELLAIRAHCFHGTGDGRVRHMSEARFLRLMVPYVRSVLRLRRRARR